MSVSKPSGKRQEINFVAGELVFRVDHDDAFDDPATFQKHLLKRPEFKEKPQLRKAVRSAIGQGRMITFDRGERATQKHTINQVFVQGVTWRLTRKLLYKYTRYFTLLFVTLPGKEYGYDDEVKVSKERQHNLLETNRAIHNQTSSSFYRRHGLATKRSPVAKVAIPPTPGGGRQTYARLARTVQIPPIFDVHAASFNWLSSAAQSIPTGGPGAFPSHAPIPKVDALPLALPVSASRKPSSVDVYILDTLPTGKLGFETEGDQVYVTYEQDGQTHRLPNTPLTEWLRTHRGCLEIIEDETPVPAELPNPSGAKTMMEWLNSDGPTGVVLSKFYQSTHPEFDVSAHGLFIADILCNVVQSAQSHNVNGNPDAPKTPGPDVLRHIYLVEGLSRWGTGTMETITRGLKRVLDAARANPDTRIVLNCSFTLQMPRNDATRVTYGLPDADGCDEMFQEKLNALLKVSKEEKGMSSILQPVFDLLREEGVMIVAAAGNDWDNIAGQAASNRRPIARYPAAYDSVVGVASLRVKNKSGLKGDIIARYSNRADEPPGKGFAVFGGNVHANAASSYLQADPNEGIAGLYVGTFPDGTSAQDAEWRGYWAGTSFAAPIVSGALAVLLASGADLETSLQQLRDKHQEPDDMTPEGEEIIWLM